MHEDISILAGQFIDGTGGEPVENMVITIRDGVIASLTPATDAGEGTQVIDARHLTVMPGLIDCHVHLCFDPVPDVADWILRDTDGLTLLRGVRNAEKTLRSGVTTVRNVGTRSDLDFDLRDGINEGLIIGPRIVGAGRVICITGGHCHFMGLEADGPDQIRRAVRTMVKAGAQVIKLTVTGGISTPGTKYGRPTMGLDEIRAAVEEAHMLDRKVCAHAQGWEAISRAVEAGVDSIEHGFFRGPDDPNLDMMIEKGISLVPTLISYDMVIKYGVEGGIPAEAVLKAQRAVEDHRVSFNWAVERGVTIAMGSDAGTEYNDHGTNPGELEYMVKYSTMSSMDAIVASTRNAAQLLDIDSITGTLEVGKCADMIAMADNPLKDITAVQRLEWVMKDGALVS